MKNFLIKIIFALSVSTASFFFADIKEVRAECQFLEAKFRALNLQGEPIYQFPITGWYRDDQKPFVYIDVETSGCNGQAVEFSLTESDDLDDLNDLADDDVNGTDLSITAAQVAQWLLSQQITDLYTAGVWCNTNLSYCLDNRPIPIGGATSENNFTLVLRAGEDECDQESDIDCNYYVRFNNEPVPETVDTIFQVPSLNYNCHGLACDENWEFIAKIGYEGVYSGDPNNPTNIAQNQTNTEATIGVTNVPVDIENPIGPSDMTIIDFIEKIIDFAITVGIPIVAIAIIYSGLLFVTARGNSSQIETAKSAFAYAVIGGALLLGAWIFARIIRDALDSLAMIMNYFV
jgi:hypothetical protein